MELRIEELSVRIAARTIVEAVDLTVPAGRLVGLVGPNGSGKSTILACTYRALRPAAGRVSIDGTDTAGMSMRDGARVLAALHQHSTVDFDFTVEEVVATGRFAHTGTFGGDPDGKRVVAESLDRAGAAHLTGRSFLQLSGGERQRVLIARALAQQPRVLVLDEPTNHLDIRHQIDVLRGVRDLGVTVLTALHDLNLAAQFCDLLHVLDHGRIVASGTPFEVLTPELARTVFGVSAHIVAHPETGAPQLLFSPTPFDDQERSR